MSKKRNNAWNALAKVLKGWKVKLKKRQQIEQIAQETGIDEDLVSRTFLSRGRIRAEKKRRGRKGSA